MSDNFEFEKSCIPQGSNLETNYVSKNFNYIPDINSGSYTNTSLSLVQFDLTSIYNSTKLTNPSECYLAIPITTVSVYTTGTSGSLVAPIAGSVYSTGLKPGYWNLIEAADVQWSGKQLEQYQNNLNAYISFKMLSDMSVTDLKQLGPTLGMGSVLDGWESAKFNGSANSTLTSGALPGNAVVSGGIGGNGFSNNAPFALSGNSNQGDQATTGNQYNSAYNAGLFSRLSRVCDVSGNVQNLYGVSSSSATTVVTNVTNLVKEFRPYYTISNTNYMVWYDVAIIRLCDVFDSFKNLPLTKRMDCTLRLYLNTGTVASALVGASNGVSTGLMATSLSTNTFSNTCPLIQTALITVPNNASGIVSGLFVGNSVPTTSISLNGGNVNLASSGASHFMNSCRFYFPQIELKPQKLIPYLSENRNKKVCYTTILSNQINSISAGATFSQLIQSGVTKIKSVIIIPLISSSTHGTSSSSNTGITPFSPLQSPFSIAPNETGPISLINVQVTIGGINIYQNVQSYSYELFLEQILLYNNINGAQVGITCGLISQDMWQNNYRIYYTDCSRCNEQDLNTPRNISISFINNSLQTIDCLVYTEYYKDCVIDVETGMLDM
jgi:hypothetical protein